MPDNKKALIRYRVLDKCFSDKYHKFYIDELVEKCNDALEDAAKHPVSKRQIYADIEFMKSSDGWNAPIVSIQDGKRKYIKYSYDFSITEAPITDMELEQLQTLIVSLSRLQGIPCYDWIGELLTNLRYKLGVRGGDNDIIGFEQNRDMKGIKCLPDLIDYIIKKHPIELCYKSFTGKDIQWTIHPYYLKQYNNRWYLLGYNDEYRDISIIPLDRIEGMKLSDVRFVPNRKYDFNSYFKDIIGVSFDKDLEVRHIVLRFSKGRLPYVVSKPIHHSQYVEDEEQGIITLDVIPNKELVSQLLWFGNDVEIVSPTELKQQIMQKIKEMYQIYFDVK